MDEQVHVTAIFRAKADRVDDLIAVLKKLAAPSRQETGCIKYGFNQDTEDSTVIIAVETWQDAQVFSAHMESQHFIHALGGLSDVLSAEPVIHQCKKII